MEAGAVGAVHDAHEQPVLGGDQHPCRFQAAAYRLGDCAGAVVGVGEGAIVPDDGHQVVAGELEPETAGALSEPAGVVAVQQIVDELAPQRLLGADRGPVGVVVAVGQGDDGVVRGTQDGREDIVAGLAAAVRGSVVEAAPRSAGRAEAA